MQEDLSWLTILFLIFYGHILFLIFLIVSTVLPDKVSETGIDLKAYYFKNHTYFWGLMSAMLLITLFIYVAKSIKMGVPIGLIQTLASLLLSILAVILIVTKKYWVHSVVLILLTAIIILEIIES